MKKLVIVCAIVISLLLLIYLYFQPPISAWRNFNQGVKEFRAGNYPKAREQFKDAMQNSKAVQVMYNWAVASWKVFEQQREDLNMENNEIKLEIQNCLSELKYLYNKEFLPQNLIPNIRYIEGRLFLLWSDFEKAKVSFEQALSNNKNFKPALIELVKLKSNYDTNGKLDPEL
jgi:tetratricopeptide (TPR) repeat protein